MTMHPLLQRQHYLLVLAIERCAIALPEKKVLLEVLSACTETARQQHAEKTTMIILGCQIDLERWAERLKMEPATLLQTVHILLEEGYLHHDPEEPFADGAWLTWNLAFDTWPCFAPPPKRLHARQTQAEEADQDEDTSEQPRWSPQALLAKRWRGGRLLPNSYERLSRRTSANLPRAEPVSLATQPFHTQAARGKRLLLAIHASPSLTALCPQEAASHPQFIRDRWQADLPALPARRWRLLPKFAC